MNQLVLIRAASEDVAAARVLLRERVGALGVIVQGALEHGVPSDQVDEAKSPSWNVATPTADEHQALTAPEARGQRHARGESRRPLAVTVDSGKGMPDPNQTRPWC